MIASLLIALAPLWQQPVASPSRSAQQQRLAAFDTTGAAVADIADRVADVRSAMELFRRAVFNAPDGEVLTTSELLRDRCRAMDSVAVRAPGRICRSCAAAKVNTALVGYRAAMPGLARTGARCAARLAQLAKGREAAKGLRRDVRNIGNGIVTGITPYEQRLRALREALGVVPPRAAPVPRAPRPRPQN